MSSKQSDSKKFEIDDVSSTARRRTEFLPDGAYFFEDELEANGVLAGKVITCAAWLLEVYELQGGELFFARGEKQVRPNEKRFGVLYPPFSITQSCFENARGRLTGIASIEALPEEFTSVPVVFDISFAGMPMSVSQVKEILHSSCNRQSIEANPRASPLSRKAKKLIDENYLVRLSMARIAARIGVTHEHFTRQFKRDFDMSPTAYLHQLRIADATFRLAKGEEIIAISQEVGYNDLSRFYKQFRKSTKTSPSSCRRLVKPQRAS